MKNDGKTSEMVLFQDANGKTSVNVRLDDGTVWLSIPQMADLFGKNIETIRGHLKNIFKDEELEQEAASRDFLEARKEGSRSVSKNFAHYNLDAIISVGYRVNSKQGVKFRQWATKILNDHLTQGFSLNQHRIAERGITEAQQAMNLLARTLRNRDGLDNETREVLSLIEDYAKTWKTLLQYDEESLPIPSGTPASGELEYATAIGYIGRLKDDLIRKGEATPLFGQERGEAFAGILGNIEQTMFGDALYKRREEKAANLLYFLIKDHPFSDGNKRIGSFLFLRYMQQQEMNVNISPDALTALALLVAESDPANKDLMIRLTMNSIVEHQVAAPVNNRVLAKPKSPSRPDLSM